MKIETKIKLDKFKPRDYQLPICDALENKGYKRILAIMPRRAGKDVLCWNLLIRQALRYPGTIYFYVLPTYSMCRKIIWNNATIDGFRLLDFIPAELIESSNQQQMSIRFINGSFIQLVGSDEADKSLVGTNAHGMIFSEYALQDPRGWQLSMPILRASNGFAIFISTPRGKNHMWELWNIASHNPQVWFAYKLTIEQTNHVSLQEIQAEMDRGEISEDLVQSEYYCSFEIGVEGAYYAKYLDRMRLKGQIGVVPWEPSFKVHTAWDIGMDDSTIIIFFQVVGQVIRIIDCYENNRKDLAHYAKIIESKEYVYGKHIGPHDIKVQEMGTGMTRVETMKRLGVQWTEATKVGIIDGIEQVRSSFGKIWIDEVACKDLIKALENYRQEYDSKKKVYKNNPLHDWSSHYADAMRYLCVSLPKTRDGLSSQELDNRYRQAVYGNNSNMPSVFRDDLPPY